MVKAKINGLLFTFVWAEFVAALARHSVTDSVEILEVS